jgi:hypothetical protein
MLNNQGSESKHAGIVDLNATTGVKGEEYKVFIENRVRFQCEGVGGTNVVACEGRIRGASLWTSLATCTGSASAVADCSTYDFIRFNVTTADGSGKCISSGFISMF